MAESNYRTYLHTDQVRAKKYFYVLRPLLAAKWILDRECPPPMLFSELVEAELEDCLKPELERLLEMKKELLEAAGIKNLLVNDYPITWLDDCAALGNNIFISPFNESDQKVFGKI